MIFRSAATHLSAQITDISLCASARDLHFVEFYRMCIMISCARCIRSFHLIVIYLCNFAGVQGLLHVLYGFD